MLQRVLSRMACREARRWSLLAERHLALGDAEKAVACCVKSLAARPETDAAISLMAKALMPGDDYLAILSPFHELLRPQSYVEIGVAHGDSLTLAKPETRRIARCFAQRLEPHCSGALSHCAAQSD